MGFAQEAEAPPAVSEELVWMFNSLLFLIGGFLVFFMAAGFAMLEGGLRSVQERHHADDQRTSASFRLLRSCTGWSATT